MKWGHMGARPQLPANSECWFHDPSPWGGGDGARTSPSPTPELTRGLHALTLQTHALRQQRREQPSNLALRHSISESAKAVHVYKSRPVLQSDTCFLCCCSGTRDGPQLGGDPECDLNLSCPCFFFFF